MLITGNNNTPLPPMKPYHRYSGAWYKVVADSIVSDRGQKWPMTSAPLELLFGVLNLRQHTLGSHHVEDLLECLTTGGEEDCELDNRDVTLSFGMGKGWPSVRYQCASGH